jgi:hypothetical protein
MRHITYITINLLNSHYYIGKHSTDNIEDGYLGSGKILLQAVKKYGRDNFARIILGEYDSSEDALAAEALLVNETVVSDSNSYNCKVGGLGLHELRYWAGKKMSDSHRLKLSIAHSGKTLTDSHKALIAEGMRKSANRKSVSQYDKEWNLIDTHESLIAAADAVGGGRRLIGACAGGKRNSAYGYYWEFEN